MKGPWIVFLTSVNCKSPVTSVSTPSDRMKRSNKEDIARDTGYGYVRVRAMHKPLLARLEVGLSHPSHGQGTYMGVERVGCPLNTLPRSRDA